MISDSRRSLTRNWLSAAAGIVFSFLAVYPSAAILELSAQLQLGNPTDATADVNNHDHFLIQRSVYAIDYNDHRGQPNWVSWDLTSEDLGGSGRNEAWADDPALPASFYPVPTGTYGSDSFGQVFSRGHMCPSGDRTVGVTTNKLVFFMSNMIPQASNQNSGNWAQLEDYCRNTLLTGGNELLITCGPSRFTSNSFYSGHVLIPAMTWKIVVVCPPGTGTATNRITASTQVIAVRIPNTNSVAATPWQNFRTNVVAIENETGFTFFKTLPPNVATVLRNKIDGQAPAAPTIAGFSPNVAPTNSVVTITGLNFVFTTNVTFNGVSAAFTINSTSNLTAIVPPTATAGPIAVAGLGGTAITSSNFNILNATVPDLAVSVSHSGNFFQGDTGDTYTIVVTNVSSAGSSGLVTVSNSLPAGLVATAISGTGWTTDLGTLTSTRTSALGGYASYPPITITVDVAPDAPASVTNFVIVAGGGETNLLNNTASDPTSIGVPSAPTATTVAASNIGNTSATLNGTINPNGNATSVSFEYGLTTSYGTQLTLPGTFGGGSVQAVGTNVTGLAAATTYHFRINATNGLGGVSGLDQTFITAPAALPDLSVTLSHAGSFVQGDTNASYTIIVTNVGAATSSGLVTVTNAIPSGLTVTAFNGSGWTFNVGARTCTRSDGLAANSSYPAITATVTISTNAASLVTNVVIVSGGGESNLANNTASDPTTVIAPSGSLVTLAGWDTSALPGGSANYGPSPFAPTTYAPQLSISGLIRGSGVLTSGTAAGRAWGGNNFGSSSAAAATNAGQFVGFSVAVTNGYTVSYSAISKFDYRRSAQGPTNGLLQYQVGSGPYVDIATLSYSASTSSGGSLGPINLSAISALQNVPAGTNVNFRISNWNAPNSGGTWYIFDAANSTASDFAVQGYINPTVLPNPDLAISISHTGSFTEADTNRFYTITVTNTGTGPTVGAVTVAHTLPGGLTATALSGSGWTVNLEDLTCTRSDVLPAGAAYPPITLTVNVDADTAAVVTNVASVSGGGDITPANNTASDPTTIIQLTPVQAWRYEWFGTTANAGNAADGAVLTSDGLPNLVKYALALDPTVPAELPVLTEISTGFLRLTAQRNPDATDVTFIVEVTDDPTGNTWTTSGITVDINTPSTLQVHDNAAVSSSPARYIRLRISRP